MKKYLLLLAVPALLMAGCASPTPVGCIYTEMSQPIAVGDEPVQATKVGRAVAKSYLGMVATGDGSIAAAAKNGGITKISHVDYEASNVLGVFGTYTTIVYGE